MISEIEAKRLVKRMAQCMKWVPDNVGEVVSMLERKAKSLDHAKKVVDQIIDLETDFPTAAAIADRCDSAGDPQFKIAAPDCPDCEGTGWMQIRVGSYEGVLRCRCGGYPPGPMAA